jgi:hypothetical protein
MGRMGTPGLHPFLEFRHAQASRPVVPLQGGKATPGACQIGGAETDAVGQHSRNLWSRGHLLRMGTYQSVRS